MGRRFHFPKRFQREFSRCLVLVGLLAVTYVVFQSILLPYRISLRSLLPYEKLQFHDRNSCITMHMDTSSIIARGAFAFNYTDSDLLKDSQENYFRQNGQYDAKERTKRDIDEYKEKDPDAIFRSFVNGSISNGSLSDNISYTDESSVGSVEKQDYDIFIDEGSESDLSLPLEQVTSEVQIVSENDIVREASSTPRNSDVKDVVDSSSIPLSSVTLSANSSYLKDSVSSPITFVSAPQTDLSVCNDSIHVQKSVRKKFRWEMPPKSVTSISEMNNILIQQHSSPRAKVPLWPSIYDKEILEAKLCIKDAPSVMNDQELHAPVFRNVSMFKRSYELMDRVLRVYVYKDGEKPIFHQPVLEGIYASEGWFMKLLQKNKKFVVKDPHKANLFYMPFSSQMLKRTLLAANSSYNNLRQYLKGYSAKISSEYPYWNRTGGADHFLVACHDSAPYAIRHHMEDCIKALCNADVTRGFKIGRDVSLPETYVHFQSHPLKYLGGKPPSERHILAFYAGRMHGYLRPILLKYWKDKDPNMKINGPMTKGVKSRLKYIDLMRSSKYCICPKGHDVNSPRIVESIFYECVPVIISDNFVPPFFDVLNWEAFSVIIAEKDIANLRDTLLSISEEKYLKMQLSVKKVQKHFLWHAEPIKYDLFHMILHSIWYSRVFQLKLS